MGQSYKDLMRSRKSVRSFDGKPLAPEDRRKLENYVAALENPFGVPIRFRFLNAKDHGVSSPVVTGADEYLAAKVGKADHYEIAFGYSFEMACLYASSLGIGTVMLAASLGRKAFEEAMQLEGDEVLPVASPLGYPAAKRSVRESLMRKGLKADERMGFESLFFDSSFEKPLAKDAAGAFGDALELARWAPSAGNKQPWRAVVAGGTVHFYEHQSMKENALGDIQKVDVGIALCHFDLAMREDGLHGRFAFDDPGVPAPEDTHYIVSFEVGA